MAIEGALQEVGLADICQLMAMGRRTGCLTLTNLSNFGYIYFENGRVIHASVLNRPDRLGDLLVKNGAVGREELEGAVKAQAEGQKGRLGEILIARGVLGQEQLEHFIRVQIEEAVYHLFTWNQGSFHFDTDQRPDDDLLLVDLGAEGLLLEGARRVDEWSLIEKKIPSFDLVFHLAKDPREDAEDFELTPDQEKIVPLLDGERSVQAIVAEVGMVDFDVAKALYGLIQAGFVDKAGKRAAGIERQGDERIEEHLKLGGAFQRAGMLEHAVREFQEVLALDPVNPRALFRTAAIRFRQGDMEGALEDFERLPPGTRDSWPVLRNRALALELMDRYDEALDVLARATELHPDEPDVLLARGIALLKTGRAGDAVAALEAYRDDAHRLSALYYSYMVLAAGVAGDLDRAVDVGREGLEVHPECGPLLVNTGSVLEERGEVEAAVALYGRAVKSRQPPAQAHKSLGDHAYDRGNAEQARMHYEKAVRIDPRLGDDVYLRLGTLAFRDDDVDVARLLWERALDLNPDNERVKAKLQLLEAPA